MKLIPVSSNRRTFVDDDIYSFLKGFNWWLTPSGSKKYYATTSINGKSILMHRLITTPPRWAVVDHINGNSLDNRKCNLKVVTPFQNKRNLKTKKTSNYPGVWQNKNTGKWIANIHFKGKNIYLGSHYSEGYAGALAKSIYKLIDTGVIK